MDDPSWFWEVTVASLVTDHPVNGFNDGSVVNEDLLFSLMESLGDERAEPVYLKRMI